VHDATRVRGGQRGRDLGTNAHGGRPRQTPHTGEDGGKRLAVNKLHHDVRHRLTVDRGGLAVVVHVGDVRMAQPRRGLRLRPQPAPEPRA
jgi:hypothetical protein